MDFQDHLKTVVNSSRQVVARLEGHPLGAHEQFLTFDSRAMYPSLDCWDPQFGVFNVVGEWGSGERGGVGEWGSGPEEWGSGGVGDWWGSGGSGGVGSGRSGMGSGGVEPQTPNPKLARNAKT